MLMPVVRFEDDVVSLGLPILGASEWYETLREASEIMGMGLIVLLSAGIAVFPRRRQWMTLAPLAVFLATILFSILCSAGWRL